MAVEAKRGCGYRKQFGLYLVSGGMGVSCDRLPFPLTVCPTCSHGFKQSRGWTWVDVNGLVGGIHKDCADEFGCPLCMETVKMGRAGMIWIGEKFYKTPAEFNKESVALGVSRRIKAIPRGFKVNETWVLLAHPLTVKIESCPNPDCAHPTDAHGPQGCRWDASCACEDTPPTHLPGIFKVWRPERVEKILPDTMRNDTEELEKLAKQGITPVFVPADDPDHKGSVYDSESEDESEENGNGKH